jgi:hypothetical protein
MAGIFNGDIFCSDMGIEFLNITSTLGYKWLTVWVGGTETIRIKY